MKAGWIHALRAKRRGIARALIAAMLLPVLLALLPPLSVSAADALERDLAQSVCGQPVASEQGGGTQRHSGHDHCILAGSACSILAPAQGVSAPAFAATPLRLTAVPVLNRHVLPPLRPLLLLSASPPRGPPVALRA